MNDVATQVRDFFQREPNKVAQSLPKGGEYRSDPPMGYGSLLDAYGYGDLKNALDVRQGLMARYIDYESMEDYPEISATYDIYADDATQPDFRTGRSVWVKSKDRSAEENLNGMLHKQVRIEDDIWPLARTVGKYGNVFGENLVNENGVIGVNYLPTPTTRRIEDKTGRLLGFLQDTSGRFGINTDEFVTMLKKSMAGEKMTMQHFGGEVIVYEDWEVTHWRLMSKHLRSIYGYGIGEPARWIWKRLMLLEDALLIYKLTRAPSRYAFYVDTGGLDQERGLAYVNRVAQKLKRKKFVDPLTGRPDLKYNPLAYDEDFFIPVRDGRESTRVDVLSGPDFQSTEDVEYFQQKLFAALKVPKAYLGQLEDVAKAVLSQEDVQFARTIMRIQRVIESGLRKICRVHLAAMGIRPSSVDFEVKMTTPSTVFDLARMEVMSAQSDLASRMQEMVPMSWVLQNVFHFSEDEAVELLKKKDDERIHNAEVEAKGRARETEITMAAERKFEGAGAYMMNALRQRELIGDPSFEKRMTGGISSEQIKKLDDKVSKLFSQNDELARKLAKTNLFLQEVRHSMKSRAAV